MKAVCFGVLALVLAAAAGPATHYDMGPARRFDPATGEENNFVRLNGAELDTRAPDPGLPAELLLDEHEDVRQPCIVQFDGPIDRRWVRDLARLGFESYGYVPHYATICRLDPVERELVRSLPFVRWVGLHHPGWRIEPALLKRDGPVEVVAAMAPGGDEAALLAAAGELGEVVSASRSGLATTVRLVLGAGDIARLARHPDVFWVQEYSEPTVANNQVQWVTQTGWKATAQPDTALSVRTSWLKGVRGQGVVLSTTDTGLNTGHDMFRDPALPITPPGIWPAHRKVVAFKLYQGANAGESPRHGSHVNGTVAGNDSDCGGMSFYDGMAKDARLCFVDLTNSSGSFTVGQDLWPLWDTVYAGRGLPDSLRPIKQHSGSWGWSNSSGTYLLMDASTDAFNWAHKDFLNIMAAGNESSTRRLRNPGIAKNVMTVGATGNGTTSNTIATFSSEGPTQDNRLKPNVMAPGVSLYSARMAPATNTYEQLSGTSMATPAVNGTVGLMRCYLQEGYYPTGSANPSDRLEYISAALLRAMAMASADPNVSSYTVPSYAIGWGRIDADSVLHFTGDARKLALCDDTTGLATGQYKQYDFQVYSALPLRVALAWTDTAAAPNANPTLVNDLNLELVSPSGTSYRGNQYSGGQSVPNPTSWDAVNVEECARVNSPETGVWTVKVYGQNVATAANQPFAWCITGDVSLNLPDVGVTSLLAPAGTIDSTASVAPVCSVHNFGNVAASYRVRARVGTCYDDSAEVTDHQPGTTRLVTFPAKSGWPRGSHAVSCSTRLAGDVAPDNDSALGAVLVRVLDAAAVSVDAPTGVVYRDVAVQPLATVRNAGSAPQAFDVAFSISDGYADTANTGTLAPGASVQLSFADWTPATTGSFAVGCSVRLAGDMVNANDTSFGSVTVHYRDVGVMAIVEPAGSYVAGDTVRPAATWRNNGTVSADVEAWLMVSDPADAEVYREMVSCTGLAPGDSVLVDGFAGFVPEAVGDWTARCSTGYAGDQLADNDEIEQGFAVLEPGIFDVAVAGIIAPAGWLDTGAVVVPRGRVKNHSDRAVNCEAWFVVSDPAGSERYREQVAVIGLELGEEREVGFPEFAPGMDEGTWLARCSVAVARDTAPGNDLLDREFEVSARPDWPFGWVEVARMPAGAKQVKDGGWLAIDEGSQLIYATRGNKTPDFFAYDAREDTWTTLASIPDGIEGKPPRKGSRGIADGNGFLYATKGNNTFGFWKYDIQNDTWGA
ncbi:S8 family serine peptidase, partial [candidate division WOR-3 bacterium]|nr:S8 family serine peptidase [candidate division WOR-3 bacterium]